MWRTPALNILSLHFVPWNRCFQHRFSLSPFEYIFLHRLFPSQLFLTSSVSLNSQVQYPLLFGSHIPCVRKHQCLWSLVLELESGALAWLVYRGFNSVPWVFPNPWSHIVRWLYTVSGTQYVLSKVRYHYCWDRLDPERFHWMLVKMNREYEEHKYSLR